MPGTFQPWYATDTTPLGYTILAFVIVAFAVWYISEEREGKGK